MTLILDYLEQHGPARSSDIAEALSTANGLSADAARKRLSRVKLPIRRFPISLLSKRESFLYHENQRGEERFWLNFHQAMRSSGSIFGIAIDGLLARRGLVHEEEFAVISGATATRLKKQS